MSALPAYQLPLPGPFTVMPVQHGLAETLARIAHFRTLTLPEVDELDEVAIFLIGDVGDRVDRESLWDELRDDTERLWHLITDDWDQRDLDEADDLDPWALHDEQIEQIRYERTRDRLCSEIESTVALHRHQAVTRRRADARRCTVQSAAVLDILGRVR